MQNLKYIKSVILLIAAIRRNQEGALKKIQ